MRVAVFSDSHTDIEHMKDIVTALGPDAIIHLGDHISDAHALEQAFTDIPLHCVAGNCDYAGENSLEQLITLAGKKLLLTHGHRYQVKTGLRLLCDRGLTLGADIVLFGHTHKALVDASGNMLLMNPGHIARFSYGATPASYGLIELGEKDPQMTIVTC